MMRIVIVLVCLCCAGCGSPASTPVRPAIATPPGLSPDADAGERVAYYQQQVADLSQQLGAAREGLACARTDAAQAELDSWRRWTRWVGLAGVALAVLIGGALSWLVSLKIGLPVGAIIGATSLAVVGYGAALRWLPLALAVAVALGIVAAVVYWRNARWVARAASRVIDAKERASDAVADAKEQLGHAVNRAGLRGYFDRLRGDDRTWA